MLKNRMFGKKIRNITILIMVIIIMLGAYRYIRNSLAENIIKIDAIALDNYGYLEKEKFQLDAKEIGENLFEIEVPESVNSKKVNKAIKMTLGDKELKLTDNKVQLTQEQLDSAKINLEVVYDMQIKEENNNGTIEKVLLSKKTEEEIKNLNLQKKMKFYIIKF